jgi:hypothetical protein
LKSPSVGPDSSEVDFVSSIERVSEAKLIWHKAVTQRRFALVAPLCVGLVTSSLAIAQHAMDPPLTKVRSWTLADRDLSASQTRPNAYRLRLEMAVVSGPRWAPDLILDAAKRAAAILAQCDIQVSPVQLHEFSGPQRYRYLFTPDSREFARRAGLGKPAIFFVDDTLQRPAFDAEAIGRANAKTRPEMADTVWITAAIRDLPVALAHELVHVLTDSGDHSNAPNNLMRDDTAPGNTHLTPEQCSSIIATGQANGLIDHGIARDDRR